MRKFKVRTIAHQLKNKVIAKYGDIVDESQLEGNAGDLIAAKFIELVDNVDEVKIVDVVDESQLAETDENKSNSNDFVIPSKKAKHNK